MTDLEMTKLCAEAMGYRLLRVENGFMQSENHYFIQSGSYNPLHDDAQVMALVKKFNLRITGRFRMSTSEKAGDYEWMVRKRPVDAPIINADLSRAIVECVAKMQKSVAVQKGAK